VALDREAIFVALQERLTSLCPSIQFVTRQALNYEQAGTFRQPSLEILSHSQTPKERRGMPPVWTLATQLVVFVRSSTVATPTDGTTSDTALNAIVTEIEAALETQPGEDPDTYGTTLGGLVSHCWISGSVDFVQGVSGGQAWALIPVEILAAGKRN
jgi:hypothetical protein